MHQTIRHLADECGWPAARIHLFGFAQGGTVAGEAALRMKEDKLGSVVSVSGPLLSYPTSTSGKSKTPFLLWSRTSENVSATALKRGFEDVREVKSGSKGEGMPRSKDEWEGIMRFWSERLSRRAPDGSGLYEVMTGA